MELNPNNNSSLKEVFIKNCIVNISRFIASLVNAAELGNITQGNTVTRLLEVNISVSDSQSKIVNAGTRACLKTSSTDVNIEHSTFDLKRCSQEIENIGTEATMSLGKETVIGNDALVRLDGIKSYIGNIGEGAQYTAESYSNQADTTNEEETLEFSDACLIPNTETHHNLITFCSLNNKIFTWALNYMWYLLLLAIFLCFLFSAINLLKLINARPTSYFVLILWSIWIIQVQVSYNENEFSTIIEDLKIHTINSINDDWWSDFILFGYHVAISASSFIMLNSITTTSILLWLPSCAYLLYILQIPPINQYLKIRKYLINVS